jgi:NAD(P)-dependent dehydrogenase (short-subunit alcohol dehydrogenase family)
VKNIFGLKDEIAVVTGALGKLGPIWIETLLDAGASVCALDLANARVSEDFSKLQTRFDKTRLKLERTDVKNRQLLEAVCKECMAAFGVPTILVNNAGIDRPPADSSKGYRLEEIPLAENREIFEVNTLGLFQVTQIFGARMVAAGRGSIINIGSLYAGVSPDQRFYDHIPMDPPFLKPPAYGASKAAVVNLTRYLATLWAPHGVRVNALSPGGVLGGQDEEFKRKFCHRVPMGRMATAEDLRGPLLFLASEASAYVTGTELIVDGGFTAW